MKESYWGYWLILLGIFVMGVMLLVNSTTTGTTQDYYLLKEVTQASMVDAIDYSYYRLYGDVKMSKAKFVENFLRRFAESNTISKEYTVSFYDIREVPPKVSVMVESNSNTVNIANDSTSFDLVNKIDVILVGGVSNESSSSSTPGEKICSLGFFTPFLRYVAETADISSYSNLQAWKTWAAENDTSYQNTQEFSIAINKDLGSKLKNISEDSLKSIPLFANAPTNSYYIAHS